MKQHDFILRVPANHRGRAFIEDLRMYLNTDTYKLGKLRYAGKKATAFRGHTREVDATAIRVYLKDKRQIEDTVTEVSQYKRRAEAAEKKLNTVRAYLNSIKAHLSN